jgi:hypothetical protein
MSWALLGTSVLLVGLPALLTPFTQTSTTLLRAIHVDGTSEQLVITLKADGPLEGALQQIPGATTRVFIDLTGVRPQVDAVIPVDRGPVLRIRTALHRAQPPVTRVVLDVSRLPVARLERGESARELRIVVGEAAGTTPESASGARDKAWCLEVTGRLAAMLDGQTPSTSQPVMLAASTAWESLEREVAARQVSSPFQPIHFMLLQAVRLGRIGTTHQQTHQAEQAAAALAGARLMLNTALTRLESLQ